MSVFLHYPQDPTGSGVCGDTVGDKVADIPRLKGVNHRLIHRL